MTVFRPLVHALIGGVVTIGVGLVPVVGPAAPFVGGGVAGYLYRRGTAGGAVVGALTGGILTAISLFLLLSSPLFGTMPSAGGTGPWMHGFGGPAAGSMVSWFLVSRGALIVLVGGAGGALGGAIGGRRESVVESKATRA